MKLQYIHNKLMRHVKIGFAMFMALMIGFTYVSGSVYSSNYSPGEVYYVSVNGDDSNPGTKQLPWRTIQKAADSLVAGETVLVRDGVYEEFVEISNSGTLKDGYITFQAYPGEHPILEGKNLKPSSSNNSLLVLEEVSYVVVDGFEIRGLSTSSSNDYISGLKVRGGGSHINIINNNIHSISNYSEKGNAHGLIVYGDSSTPIENIKISGNEIHHLVSGSSESLTLDGNIKNFTVEYNTVHDNNNIGIDIIGHYETCSNPCQDQARDGLVAYNVVYNIDTSTNPAYGGLGHRAAAGIYIDGGTNIIVENNEVFNSNFGIELASEIYGKTTSNVIVRNNFLHNNHGAGIIMGGSGEDNGGAHNNTISNNTLYMNDALSQGYGEITLQNYNLNNKLVNNIIYTASNNRFIKNSETTGANNIVDYNLYYRDGGVDSTSWRYNGVKYTTWEAFKNETGFDHNSTFADPLFVDIENNGPYIAENSPAIDQGTSQFDTSIKIDYYNHQRLIGSSIDMGAAEYKNARLPKEPMLVRNNHPILPEALELEGKTEPLDAPPIVEQTAGVHPGTIIIDGNSDDWASIPELSTSTSNVNSMKALMTNDKLHVLITGKQLTEKGQLFINTGTEKTVFEVPYWSNSGADFMIENGVLYKYNGTGSSWDWIKVTSYLKTEHYSVNASVVEYGIPITDIGVKNETISVGYTWKDSISDKLPSTNHMELISPIKDSSSVSIPSFNDYPSIEVDGKANDWGSIPVSLTGGLNVNSVKVTNDSENLYMIVEGKNLNSKFQVYINANLNGQPSYQSSNWPTTGIDYLLESSRLYSYTGTGKNWAFKEKVNLKNTKKHIALEHIIEISIPLNQLNVTPGQHVKLGVLLNDNKLDKLPANGDMVTYKIR